MDTATAFARGEAARREGARSRVFDWDKAAAIIASGHVTHASAGLSGDWNWTGGPILAGGQPVPAEDTYTYLSSLWAIPQLSLMDETAIPCWRRQGQTRRGPKTPPPPTGPAVLRPATQAALTGPPTHRPA